jgi:subtilisin family serine protease
MLAIDRAVTKGVVVVAPSGNEGAASLDVPASYPHVIAVGATDASGRIARFSNTGPGLDLVAPGQQLVVAAPPIQCDSGYARVDGTSFAAPIVAAAAALLSAAQPGLDPSQVARMLDATGAAWTAAMGYGIANIPGALAAARPAAEAREVDDDVYWVRREKPLRARRGRATIRTGAVTARRDPADDYPLRLGGGARISLSAAARARLRVELWSPQTGSFDITDGRTARRLASSSRAIHTRAAKAGTYYVAVRPPAAPAPAAVDYRLSVRG